MAARQVLITGGSGYLGLSLARKYLESTEDSVLLWLHASDKIEMLAKCRLICESINAFRDRVSCCGGDLTAERPFESIDPKEIRCIIHSAAVTRFNVDLETSQKVNIEGAEKLFRFAARCPSLEALGLLSTVYASGLRAGAIEEEPLDESKGFANHYERSKWEAETLLLRKFNDVPWRIFRVATVIADDDRGCVQQQNAFHNTLRLLYYGLLSFIPGNPSTPLYFVTGRFVTAAYSDAESFNLLAEGIGAFGSSIVHQAISSVAPFARQLFIDKEIRNERLLSAWSGYHGLDPRHLARLSCQHLVKTKWGKRSAYEHQ